MSNQLDDNDNPIVAEGSMGECNFGGIEVGNVNDNGKEWMYFLDNFMRYDR